MNQITPDDYSVPTLAELPEIADAAFSGRGIVVSAGGIGMFTNAWVLVWVLRKVVLCPLPIEIWHLGPQEMSSGMRHLFEGLGADVIDASAVLARYPANICDGWQLKVYALIRSSFRQVLLLDADSVPTTDPSFLFDRPEFAETGAVFWPDLVDLAAANPIWKALDLPAEQRVSFESGQVLVDKGRHRDALRILLYLNEQAERFYRILYGDKDTFQVAWLAANSAFTLVPHRPYSGRYTNYQRGFDGKVLFQHTTGRKWNYLDREACHDEEFEHEAACLEALAELRRIWNGRFYEAPSRSLAARKLETELAGRTFVLSTPGEDDRLLELIDGSQIGKGRDHAHQTWHIADTEAGDLALRISDHHRVRHEFRRGDGDVWLKPTIEGDAGTPTCLTPIEPDGREDGRTKHGGGLVRDIVRATLAGGPWSVEVADRLRTTFASLYLVEAQVADDIEALASAEPSNGAVRAGLLALAAELKTADHRVAADPNLRTPDSLIHDPSHYIRP